MSTVTGSKIVREDGVVTAQWTITDADTGQKIVMSDYPDRTVQVVFSSGSGTVTMEGSSDGASWATLKDQAGNSLTLTTNAPRFILENTDYIRPRGTAGTFTATVTVTGAK